MNGIWRKSLQDVRVRRGADVGSDHHLVTAYFKLKLMKTVPKSSWKRFDSGKLNQNQARIFIGTKKQIPYPTEQ